MIVFDLTCGDGHRFEGWFGSSDDFARQHAGGMVSCPECGSSEIAKAPMAPAVGKKGNQQMARKNAEVPASMRGAMPPEISEALNKLAQAQAKALENSTWVGEDFVELSRAMHYGERDVAVIHGQADFDDAAELLAEGIAVAPLPFPVAPPEELN
jgi:hypothetical protein